MRVFLGGHKIAAFGLVQKRKMLKNELIVHSSSVIRVSSIRVDPELFGKIRVGNPEGARGKS